ncbi:CatB-related O-acetyltransferase [Arthrobacter sp. 7Tela_A1]|uniref:CatB-related O-acetyltransferase n=1 Tax=Arthrobacter sp. 7Tela_A1 TaxID=3093745 RepID=UPI003BB619F7
MQNVTNKTLPSPAPTTDWENRGRWAQLTRTTLAESIAKFGWEIGDHTYGRPTVFERTARLRIGKFCSIAAGVEIALGNHRTDSVSSYPFGTLGKWWPSATGISDHSSRGDVVIGNDVWIGASSFISSGVTVGHGAVIGAHAVVTKDVAPYSVVGGNPAKVIKYRFDPEVIEQLLEISWWDWTDEIIDAHLPLMLRGSVTDFIAEAQALKL